MKNKQKYTKHYEKVIEDSLEGVEDKDDYQSGRDFNEGKIRKGEVLVCVLCKSVLSFHN